MGSRFVPLGCFLGTLSIATMDISESWFLRFLPFDAFSEEIPFFDFFMVK
jgi:hypothetical protein